MSRLINYEEPRERKHHERVNNADVITKDKNCIGCKHLIGCKGKPRRVVNCLNYEERTDRVK